MAFGDKILTWIKDVRGQELERRTECPGCGYPLEEKNGILHCKFCGWGSK